jgi:hypothetical protein
MNTLPFTGWECPQCGWFTDDELRRLAHECYPSDETIPGDPVVTFLNRWAFNWRGERAVIEKELRELITKSDVGER